MKAAPGQVRGFTLLELIIVIALVVFLFATAIENLLPLRGDAERANVAMTVGTLRSALGMESIHRVVNDGGDALAEMDGANPMNWLAVTPANYSGAMDNLDPRSLAPGHWAYDRTSGTLFYRVRYPRYFEGSFTEPPGMRFRVIADRDADGSLNGVKLEQLDSGAWTTDGSELRRWLEEWQ